jgi:hypothetical protein
MSDKVLSKEPTILEALQLQAQGAWRSLDQLSQQGSASKKSLAEALLRALCTSPLQEPDSGRASLLALSHHAPRSACAIALSRSLLALSQENILTGQNESACATIRQAISSSINAVVTAGIQVATPWHDHLLDQAEDLRQILASQLDLAFAKQRGNLPAQLILVLGMHRSGTSALSGLLVQAGLDAPRDLMPATPANPSGYWESMGAMQLNDKMLNHLGREWASAKTLTGHGWEVNQIAAREWRIGLLNLLCTSFPAGGHALLKDPRLCVLLPGLQPWLESGLFSCVVFLPVRHPAEVAASLEVAEGTPKKQGLLLWLGHVFQAERHSRGLDRLIVDHYQMLADPKAVLKRCKKTIERAAGGMELKEGWQMNATSIINPRLHRQRADSEIPGWVIDEDAELWFELAMRVHTVMVEPKESERERMTSMDRLWRQWTTLAP